MHGKVLEAGGWHDKTVTTMGDPTQPRSKSKSKSS